MAKIVNFGLDPHIFDAKIDSFIPFGANFCVYLKHIGIQIIEKMTGQIVKLSLTFGQNTGLKRPVCEPSPFYVQFSLVNESGLIEIQDKAY